MLVAIRFSQRRFKHQMNPLMLLWKQMLNLLPSPAFCLWCKYGKQYTYTTVNSSILKWPSLDYLSTNCTVTFGSSHCRLLIFFRNKISKISAEGPEKRDGHATSSRKWKQSAVLYRAVKFVVFRMLKVFVKHAHRPLTYIFPQRPRKGYRG